MDRPAPRQPRRQRQSIRTLLRGAVQAVVWLGPRNMVASVLYALERDRLELPLRRARRRARAVPPRRPGTLLSVEPVPGGARLTFAEAALEVLAWREDVLRLTWSSDGRGGRAVHARPRSDGTPAPEDGEPSREVDASVATDTVTGVTTIRTPSLRLHVHPDGSLRLRDASGTLLRVGSAPAWRPDLWWTTARLDPEDRVFGLGERAMRLDLRGGRYRMWNADPRGSYGPGHDPLYASVPMYLVVGPGGSHGCFHDTTADGRVSIGTSLRAAFRTSPERTDPEPHRTWLFVGSPPRIVARFTELTGRPPLPPRWVLGYHQSRWGYRSREEVLGVARGFLRHDLPLDAIHLDIDHLDGARVFTTDPRRFGDLRSLVAQLGTLGVRVVTITGAYVRADAGWDRYDGERGITRAARLVTLPDGRPLRAPVWPGTCVFPDFTDEGTRRWWGDQYADHVEAGVAGFWHDLNEPAVFAAWGDTAFPLPARHVLDGRGGDHRDAHNAYATLMAHAADEGLRRRAPARRPWILSRGGSAGIQRWAWTWTGDTRAQWDALRTSIATLLGLGLSGVPFAGSDIGGFNGSPDAELYRRWLQLGVLTPLARTHSARDSRPREPWCFDAATVRHARAALHLRHRLRPYLYSLAWAAHRTGAPLLRPLWWHDADDDQLLDAEDAFLLGDALLVAPATEPGCTTRSVPLPRGEWWELGTWPELRPVGRRAHTGAGVVSTVLRADGIPMFQRAGSILPLDVDGTLVLRLPLASEAGTPVGPLVGAGGELYDDEGDGDGPWRLDRWTVSGDPDAWSVRWTTDGDRPWSWPSLRLELEGLTGRLWVDGEEIEASGPGSLALELSGPFRELRLER